MFKVNWLWGWEQSGLTEIRFPPDTDGYVVRGNGNIPKAWKRGSPVRGSAGPMWRPESLFCNFSCPL